MQEEQTNFLIRVLSVERLNSYNANLAATPSSAELLGCYVWNIALCESLYPSLHIIEVALRNAIHHSARAYFCQDDWYDLDNILQHDNERNAIQKAKNALKQQNKPTEPNRIVAELSFGFWTSLLDRRYEQVLWPALLKNTFPNIPRKLRTRDHLSKRFQAIRKLRNRVFHHEPIWHWKNLRQLHLDTLEAVAWIEANAMNMIQTIDRFPCVHAAGIQPLDLSKC